ncbi:MAG: hypothetical protein HQ512_04670 [Rhodospirillales bacterium]|nr:hypothetical protein [Rhodospirillales bacterium]
MYEVINLETGESHGKYETFDEARGCVSFDALPAYQIWSGEECGDDVCGECVEEFDPSYVDDDRIAPPSQSAIAFNNNRPAA